MSLAALRKGWCPGALRPMRSGDGLLVRLRLSCGQTSLDGARALADWAELYGNAALDLSARGHLQLRGVSDATLPALTRRLAEAGLLDMAPQAEAVRNVLVSPFAGLAAPDRLCERAKALEAALAGDRDLWALPGKFSTSFDAGPFPLGVETDLAFLAVASDAYVVRLAGLHVALGPFPGDEVVAVATRLARAFLRLREGGQTFTRMREAALANGVEPFASAARVARTRLVWPAPRPRADWIGAHALGAHAFVGVATPFGRLEAADLRALADLAAQAGGTALRLTPWRAILAPLPDLAAARRFAQAARALDLILDPADPLLAVAACPGAPGCSSALGPTRPLARRLAAALKGQGEGVALHVSGCAKGCARPELTRLVVVAGPRGYDLVARGRADGEPFARDLTGEAVVERLAEKVGA